MNEVMDLFKDKDEFIAFHDINDTNMYIDTKEEEDENIQNIARSVMEKYVNKNYFIDQKTSCTTAKGRAGREIIRSKFNYI